MTGLVKSTGTVAATNGATALTFTGASLAATNIKAGDLIIVGDGGWPSFVDSVDYVAQTAEIQPPYNGTTGSGLTWYSVPTGINWGSAADLNFGIADLLALVDGAQGTNGADAGLDYTFDTTTTDSLPTAGYLRLNNATLASVTAAYLNNADINGNTVSGYLDTFDDSTSTTKGALIVRDKAAATNFAVFALSGTVVDGTGYRKLTLAYVAGGGTFANLAALTVQFVPKGDLGNTGAAGANSIVRFVATANVAISTGLAAGQTVDGGTLVAGDLVLLTGQTAPAENGVYLVPASGAASRASGFATYDSLCGVLYSVMEGTAYADTLWQCTSDQGGTLGTTALVFAKYLGGSVGATDNAVPRANGTGGATLQSSGVTIDDGNGISGITSINGWVPREVLSANRTYYVDGTLGSDSNSGLSAGAGAFATIQKAVDTTYTLDIGGYSVSIDVADGTYASGINCTRPFVNGTVTITGNITTPSSCVISKSSGQCVTAGRYANVRLGGFKIVNSSGIGIYANTYATITITGPMEFGACSVVQIYCTTNATINCLHDYTISGGATEHISITTYATINNYGITVTLTGTPAFTTYFALVEYFSFLYCFGNTYSGSATGVRYYVRGNGIIETSGGGASYLPGDTAGSTATQGQYS